MKICWSNLEDIYLTKNGIFCNGKHAYYEMSCKKCNELYLGKQASQFCSRSCFSKYRRLDPKNHPNWKGGFSINNRKHHLKVYHAKYYENNRNKILIQNAEWRKNNRSKHNAHGAQYRAYKLNQTLDDANKEKINWFYWLGHRLNVAAGRVAFHVDHIIPLSQGGLHHENNLQILTAQQNLSKGGLL